MPSPSYASLSPVITADAHVNAAGAASHAAVPLSYAKPSHVNAAASSSYASLSSSYAAVVASISLLSPFISLLAEALDKVAADMAREDAESRVKIVLTKVPLVPSQTIPSPSTGVGREIPDMLELIPNLTARLIPSSAS